MLPLVVKGSCVATTLQTILVCVILQTFTNQMLHSGSLVGGVDVTTTDGITKRFSDGDVLLVEDTTGDISLCTVTMPELTSISLP